MITVFTPSFADDNNTNAQNLTVKEVVARMDPNLFRVILLGSEIADPRIARRPNTQIMPWRKRGNTPRVLFQLFTHLPDVYFFPREGQLDAGFLAMRRMLALKTALVTYVISGGLENGHRPLLFRSILESDVVAGNSRRMTETAGKLGGKNVQTVYDGIDRRYYFPASNIASAGTGKTVLFAGSFRRYKRADLVVREAMRHPDWQFRLAGIGEEQMACRELAREGNCKNVHFLDHLNAAQLGEEMRQAQLFFFPSEIEGHPQVLGQAAACGLPCIARDSYAPDYVLDGITGSLCESDDELSAALRRLIGDPDLRMQMSVAAVKHAQQFEWDAIAKQWETIMEKAVANRQNHRHQRIS
ncbi:MAG: glycosyltransferase family 4 protein [Terriglobales bacterium]|jgi:glycosyltransferase involved in cell wall biosynthesis